MDRNVANSFDCGLNQQNVDSKQRNFTEVEAENAVNMEATPPITPPFCAQLFEGVSPPLLHPKKCLAEFEMPLFISSEGSMLNRKSAKLFFFPFLKLGFQENIKANQNMDTSIGVHLLKIQCDHSGNMLDHHEKDICELRVKEYFQDHST